MIPDFVIWIVISIVAAIMLAIVIYYIIKIVKMAPEQREEAIIDFLVGLVTTVELAYKEHGKGSEKLKDVEEAFNKKAPWFLKILLAITKTSSLDELIEKALAKVKEAFEKKQEELDKDNDKVDE